MSQNHYITSTLAIIGLVVMLVSCNQEVIRQPTCYVNENPARVTTACQKEINELAREQLQALNDLQQRKRNGTLWHGFLVMLLVVSCAFAVLHGYKIFKKTTLETDRQLVAMKQQQAHERELAKIAATRDAAIAAAQSVQPVQMPHTLHITDSHNTTTHTTTTDSRRISHKANAKPLKADLLSLPEPTSIKTREKKQATAPTLAEAMKHPSHVVIGRDQEGELVLADFEEVRSVGFGGTMGAGKTSAMLWLTIQLIAKLGSNIIAFDPHSKAAGKGQSFSQRVQPFAPFFLHEPCGLSETARGLQCIESVIRNKLDGRDHDPLPFLVLMDELQALMASQHREDIQNLGRQTTDEVRKVNGFGFYALHRPYVQDIGQMGHSIQSHVVCRTNRRLAAAQMHIPISYIPQDMEALPQGVALWKSGANPEPKMLSYPHITERDIAPVIQQLQPRTRQKPKEEERKTEPVVIEVAAVKPETQQQTTVGKSQYADHPDYMKIRDALLGGANLTETIRAVYATTSGSYYKQRSDLVKAIRSELRCGGI